ncbi:hypothetical protein BFP76_07145 [Amylibacter kogurei]|uniref:Uncharacterized protein n=1 Tax=Paramylibacter kogurei TaxID=1889778 RepID=A0A2G5K676_9RHOB|nr:hypothetical protein [Amylibacter kogurei]PIB24925.1 hypothetical protein BFP76_07145 [Amylibacter kogurei]
MQGQADQTKICKVCAAEMPAGANFCITCKNWQDWRRHISIGQSSLALLVALFAVLTPLVQFIFSEASESRARKLQKLKFAISNISHNDVEAIISNPTDMSMVVREIQCKINAPIDPKYYFEEDGYGYVRWPTADEVLGPVSISYTLAEPTFVQSKSQAYATFQQEHITPVLIEGRRLVSGKSFVLKGEQISFCVLTALDENNSDIGVIVELSPIDIAGFDLLRLVEDGDYSEQQMGLKADHLSTIETVRGK